MSEGGWQGYVEVPGKPATKGSVRTFTTRVGRRLVVPDNPRLASWSCYLAAEMARTAPPRLLDAPVVVVVRVYVPRPRSHYLVKAGVLRLKPRAALPPAPPTGLDLDKVQRAIGDAGQGVWWTNDSRIARWDVARVWAPPERDIERTVIEAHAWAGERSEGDG